MPSDIDDAARTVVAALAERGEHVAAAESLTGGMIAATLTGVSGASDVFDGGVVAYLPRIKTSLVGVPAALIETEGVVSAAVAEALATGVRDACDSDWGLGTTGVAGPAPHGGRPPGTVHVGLAGPAGIVTSRGFRFDGDRDHVRRQTTLAALSLLTRYLRDVANS